MGHGMVVRFTVGTENRFAAGAYALHRLQQYLLKGGHGTIGK